MKKIYYLITIAILGIGYFFSCEREKSAPREEEIIDSTIYDSKYLQASDARAAGDGYYDYLIEGDNYKGREGLNLFVQDGEQGRKALLKELARIADSSGNKIDTSRIRVHLRNSKQSLGCNDNVGLGEGMICNAGKVVSIAAEVSNNLFTVDRIIVFANGKRSGGADASLTIISVGMGNHTGNPACSYQQQTFDGKMWHELGHTYTGFDHILLPPNKMGSCTNNCCDEGIRAFLPQHQHLIVTRINSIINH